MIRHQTLLVEIGVEELPAGEQSRLAQLLDAELTESIVYQGYALERSRHFSTPRRLAVMVEGLVSRQQDRIEQIRGPAVSAPSTAIEGFARKWSMRVDELKTITVTGRKYYGLERHLEGKHISACIVGLLNRVLKKLPLTKRMRWDTNNFSFVRPVRWVVLMLDDAVVEGEVLGLKAGRVSFGHRFHRPQAVTLNHAPNYLTALESAWVLADADTRRQKIRQQLNSLDAAGKVVIDEALLTEVSALVEWPVVIKGRFPQSFLQLPRECLITTMKQNQKYFHVVKGRALTNEFVAVANVKNGDLRKIVEGNERVIVPRLQDAEFFYQKDTASPLESHYPKLAQMTFERRLGTLQDKSRRVQQLGEFIAASCAANVQTVTTAAALCKCDLTSSMVDEFPSLQGIMGSYYARNDGYDADICAAIRDHYHPRFAGDRIPQSAAAQALAIADKMDTICGNFVIGRQPGGDSDPYAVRRTALGLLRIIIEARIDLDLSPLIKHSLSLYDDEDSQYAQAILTFLFDRLTPYYLDQNIKAPVIHAVRECQHENPYDFHRRIQAVTAFAASSEAPVLSDANKRIANILARNSDQQDGQIKIQDLQMPQERTLYKMLQQPADDGQSYAQHLAHLTRFSKPLDDFFATVTVIAEEEHLRRNRLALLQALRNRFLQVADIALLQL